MDWLETIYNDLTSDYEVLVLNFAYITKNRLQSRYFKQRSAVCPGYNIADLDIEVTIPSQRINTPASVCFPNGANSTASIILDCSKISNYILIYAILAMDPDLKYHINTIKEISLCDTTLHFDTWFHPMPMESPSNLIGSIPEGTILLSDGLVTVTNKFMVQFLEQILDILLLLNYEYDFVHGNLTCNDLAFETVDDQLNVILCNLESSALSIVNQERKLIRIRRKPAMLSKLTGEYFPLDTGNEYQLDGLFFSSNFKKLEVPFYKSYDYYTLIVSCLCMEYFFHKVMDNFILKSVIFDPLFRVGDHSNVYADLLESIGKPITLDRVVAILKKYKLRCNAMEVTRDRLAKMKNILLSEDA